jgi:uncharacterized membrane protein
MLLHMSGIGWHSIEKSSFGLIYGAIMVLSVLMALDLSTNAPFRPAIILFSSVLSMALARTLAALLSHAMETGEPVMTVAALRAAWSGSHPIMTVANVPTALFTTTGFGWLAADTTLYLSQLYCIVILCVLGARVGWVISGGFWHPLVGAVSAGGLGGVLAAMKYALR